MYLDFNNINQDDVAYVAKVLNTGYVSTAGPQVMEFEQAMADYLGVHECVATCSGTTALHLALLADGIGPGHKVILPALTFPAALNMVKLTGAEPIVVDVNPYTWCLHTYPGGYSAFIPVDLYGVPCECWSDESTALVVRDSAESLGARQMLSNYTCYSFNGNKVMTTGGGGLVVGGDSDYIRWLSLQGRDPNQGLGFNYRMTNLAAALGISQLKRLPLFLARKRELNTAYRYYLDALVKFQEAPEATEPSWWMTACLLPEEINVEWLQHKLAEVGVPTRRIFRPIGEGYFPNAQYIYNHGLCLPSSTLNTEEDVKEACLEIGNLIA